MFAPLNNVTHYSVLQGLSKPDQLAAACKNLGYTTCGIADLSSISGVAAFFQSMKKAKIKPVIGSTFYLDNFSQITLIAKNLQGWKSLIELTSLSNTDDKLKTINKQIYHTISFDDIENHKDNLIGVTSANNDDVKKLLANRNFFEIDGSGPNGVAFPQSYFTTKEQHEDYKVVLSVGLSVDIQARYYGRNYILSPEEASERFTDTQLKNVQNIVDMCEDFSILNKPQLPRFECPDGLTENEYLKKLCVEGWRSKLEARNLLVDETTKNIYRDRIRTELGVIEKAELAGYFLIVLDYIKYAQNQGWLVGPGRGSVGGSLAAYLCGITNVNPIQYSLIFERFYNEGRNTADHISLPDIDVDFPISKRELVIEYIRNKYGHDKVCQIITFGRMMGAGSVKTVLRAHNVCDARQMNEITEFIPQEAAIADQMEAADEKSIINWTLDNEPDILKNWVTKNPDGTLTGEYAKYFAQAIRLEGTFQTKGRHAAGVVISANPLDKVCPMVYNGGSERIAGFEMADLETMGLVKMDVLGVACLDKLMGVNDLLRYGRIT